MYDDTSIQTVPTYLQKRSNGDMCTTDPVDFSPFLVEYYSIPLNIQPYLTIASSYIPSKDNDQVIVQSWDSRKPLFSHGPILVWAFRPRIII